MKRAEIAICEVKWELCSSVSEDKTLPNIPMQTLQFVVYFDHTTNSMMRISWLDLYEVIDLLTFEHLKQSEIATMIIWHY